jgi:hypothetical protein
LFEKKVGGTKSFREKPRLLYGIRITKEKKKGEEEEEEEEEGEKRKEIHTRRSLRTSLFLSLIRLVRSDSF